MEKITWVLPIKAYTHSQQSSDLQRFLRIGLPSYKKFLDPTTVHSFVLITPDNEVDYLESQLHAHGPHPFDFRIIKDSWLIEPTPEIQMVRNQAGTWVYQQLLKLEVSKFVYTPLYMLIDTDLYLTKPFTSYDVFSKKQTDLRTHHPNAPYPYPLKMTTDPYFYHPDWYQASAHHLHPMPLKFDPNERVMQVTPQIMFKDHVQHLLQFLREKRYNRSIYQLELMSRGFTEYSLYWTWLKMHDLTFLYDTTCGGNAGAKDPETGFDNELDTPRLLGRPVWFYPVQGIPSLKARIHAQFYENEHFHFGLLQSNIPQIPLETAINLITPYLTA